MARSHSRNRRRFNPNSQSPARPQSARPSGQARPSVQPAKPRFTHKVSEHFSKKDFMFTAENGDQKLKISMGLIGGLELLRSLAKARISISKGYMTPEAAEKEGNWKRNYHPLGLAADITIEDMSNEEVFLLAEHVPEFKGIGLSIDGNHVHVDTRKTPERVLWLEVGGKIVDLTDELRAKYNLLPTELPDHSTEDTPHDDAHVDVSPDAS